MRKRLAEPFRSVCQHPRPLAEREPDERGALLAVVVEDRVGDGDDPGAFRQGAAEGEAAGLAEGRMPVVKAVRAAKQFLTYVASGPFPYAVAEWEGLEGAAIGRCKSGGLWWRWTRLTGYLRSIVRTGCPVVRAMVSKS